MSLLNNFAVKHRHLLTSAGNIRLRFVAVLAIFLFAVVLLVSGGGDDNDLATQNVQTALIDNKRQDAPIITQAVNTVARVIDYDPEEAGNGIAPFLTRVGKRPYFNKPYRWTKTHVIESGDALGLVMEETGLSGDDYLAALRAIKEKVDPTDIRPGHKVITTLSRLGHEDNVLQVAYVFDSLKSVVVQQDGDTWSAETIEQPLELKTRAATTTIENSIYGSLGKVGVPDGIINRMIKAYSWTVDFQRDIWGGEEVELLFETKETEDGEYIRSHRLLYANLRLRDKDLPIYLYEKDEGFPNFFEPNGVSIKRALMKTPVDGARISSGFGMRTHPVLGYNKMHKGLDFAAPTGTPIYAAGDGIVERANRFGSYGNYIRIRHNDTFKTAYAHLSRFGKGIKRGTRVKQGQIIGYVGNTGRSTGPHLHYEVIKNGQKVNPHSVDLPLGEEIRGAQLREFQREIAKYNAKFATITGKIPNQQDMLLPPRKPDVVAANMHTR